MHSTDQISSFSSSPWTMTLGKEIGHETKTFLLHSSEATTVAATDSLCFI